MVGVKNGGCGRKSFAVVDDVAKNLESHLRCVHCREFFDADARKPRFLACFHSICESCVSCWLSERNLIVCRSCGCRTDLPGGELEDLAPNEWAYGNLLFFSRSKLHGNLRMMDLPRLLSSLRQSVEDWAPFGDDFESGGEADGSVEDVAEVVDGSGNDGSCTREGQVAADASRPGVVAFNDDVIRHTLGVPLIRGPGMDPVLAQQQARVPRTWAAEPAVNRAPDPDRGMSAGNGRRSPLSPPEAASARRFDHDSTGDGDREVPPRMRRNWRRRDSSDEDSYGGRGSVVSRPTRRTTRSKKKERKAGRGDGSRRRGDRDGAESVSTWNNVSDVWDSNSDDTASDDNDGGSSGRGGDGVARGRRDGDGKPGGKPRRRQKSSSSLSRRRSKSARRGPAVLDLPVNPVIEKFATLTRLKTNELGENCAVCQEKLTDPSSFDDDVSGLDARAVVRLKCDDLLHHHCASTMAASQSDKFPVWNPRSGPPVSWEVVFALGIPATRLSSHDKEGI